MKRFASLATLLAALLVPALSVADLPSRRLAPQGAAEPAFAAAQLPARLLVDLAAPVSEKSASDAEEVGGRMRVGVVRPAPKAATGLAWTRVADGYAARFAVRSASAAGLRARLDLATLPGSMRLAVQGSDGRVETMVVDPSAGNESWTPWTEGDTQTIELLSAVRPAGDAVTIGAVVHTTLGPFAKVAGACTVSTMCPTGNSALDAAVDERKRSVMRLQFVEGGSSFICTGTLINTDFFPAPYVLTANHCIASAATAASLTTLWFYESTDCAALGVKEGQVQVSGGSGIVLTNQNVDSTLLLLNAPAPEGAVHSGWSTARLAANAPVVSISHPTGDTSRVAQGAISREYRIVEHPLDMYGVRYSSGIIQGGSSGSGLFTLDAGGSLRLTGVLSGSTVRNGGGISCTNLNEEGLYGRFEAFGPMVAPFIRTPLRAADDTPNRLADVTGTTANALDAMPSGINLEGRRIDYAGDLDVYRFTLAQAAQVSVSSYGANIDTVGSILDAEGNNLESEDDAQRDDNHFGITRSLAPGTYYLQVGHWEADGTGPYNLRLHAARVEANYTDLWWNPAESGWGINFNHQGTLLFGTLFTYDAQNRPMWLTMSRGDRQADGSYQGELFRTSGPAFDAVPFNGVTATPVGSMRVSFPTSGSGNLSYTVDGVAVTKAIVRQDFRGLPSCKWSAFDRSYASNYQDLWWNPAESGWGVNLAHQGDIVFATLFTYGADRRPTWYVMSEGNRTVAGAYSGTLYRTTGPAFNATPWTPATPTAVGTMSFTFNGGNAGTMTYSVDGVTVIKQIQRQVFSEPRTQCES